jgi:hypothetical protein
MQLVEAIGKAKANFHLSPEAGELLRSRPRRLMTAPLPDKSWD